jgi:hypothetical protein
MEVSLLQVVFVELATEHWDVSVRVQGTEIACSVLPNIVEAMRFVSYKSAVGSVIIHFNKPYEKFVVPLTLKEFGVTSLIFIGHVGMIYFSNEFAVMSSIRHITLPNGLKCVPKNLSMFTRLTSLKINGGRFAVLPESLFGCSNLEILCLGGGNLSVLSPNFKYLYRLNFLECSNNSFVDIPKEIFELGRLAVFICHTKNVLNFPKVEVRHPRIQIHLTTRVPSLENLKFANENTHLYIRNE